MSRKVIISLLFVIIVLLGLSGCGPCELVAPEIVFPEWNDIVFGGETDMVWNYPDSCTPEGFEVQVARLSDFSYIDHLAITDGSATSVVSPDLEPAREFYWRVRAIDGDEVGPWSAGLVSFFSGPICDSADLVAPTLVYPPYGGVYDNLYESIEWEWPLDTCIPERYWVEVSLDPEFVDTSQSGPTSGPGTRWGLDAPPEGTQYWWRITAASDGVRGPTSVVSMFWTAPACLAGAATPVLELPANNDLVTTATLELRWSYASDPPCAPEGFHLKISAHSDLSSPVVDVSVTDAAETGYLVTAPLDDCYEYYWSVAAISDGIETPFVPPHRFVLNQGGDCGCDETILPVPWMIRPTPHEVFPDTNAYISWENPGGCFPDGASIKIDDSPFFEDDSLDQYLSGDFIMVYEPPDLEPATQYWVQVAYSIEDGGDPVIGTYSTSRRFFTGPECASLADLTAPVLDLPSDGSVVDSLTPLLRYHPGEPGCIPDGYFINLQDNSSFSGTNLMGAVPVPSTAVISEELENCTTYYWKVNGTQDGADGPESDVNSFFVDVDGSCPLMPIPSIAKMNHFCRLGTYPEYFEALHTFEVGDPALVIARNFFSTYLQVMVVDPETLEPVEPKIVCWSLWDAFEPEVSFEFKNLAVQNPPPTPVPTEVPLQCHANLGAEDCEATGGTFYPGNNYCECSQPQ